MVEVQLVRVKHLSGKANAKLAQRAAASVLFVADYRMTDVRKVDPQLMGSSCDGFKTQIRGIEKVLQNAITREGRFAFGDRGGHFLPISPAASDMSLDNAIVFYRAAGHNCSVFFMNLAGGELVRQSSVGDVIFGGDDAPGSIFVKSVDDARSQGVPPGGESFTVCQQGVDQGGGGIAGTGVNNKSGGFVDRDQVGVLIQDLKRDILRLEGRWLRWRQYPLHDVSLFYGVVSLDLSPVQRDEAFLKQLLYVRPRFLRQTAGQELVQAKAVAGFGDRELKLLRLRRGSHIVTHKNVDLMAPKPLAEAASLTEA